MYNPSIEFNQNKEGYNGYLTFVENKELGVCFSTIIQATTAKNAKEDAEYLQSGNKAISAKKDNNGSIAKLITQIVKKYLSGLHHGIKDTSYTFKNNEGVSIVGDSLFIMHASEGANNVVAKQIIDCYNYAKGNGYNLLDLELSFNWSIGGY